MAVCRELTKRFEEVVRGTAAAVADRFEVPPKGEITLVVGSSASGAMGQRRAAGLAVVSELVDLGVPRRRAAELVARLTGESRNQLYRESL